ncbi:hypothetical protein ACFL2S_15125 [Thermodesulfobacteriota bacterium]
MGFATLSNEQSQSANTSVKMGTVDTDDRAQIAFNGGPMLNTINQLSYWSYAVQRGTYDQLTAWISIYLHTDPGKTYADWVTDCDANPSKVFYIQAEPYFATSYPALNTWQLQDAFGTAPLKWSSYECAGGGGYDFPSAAPALADYISGDAMDWSVPGNDNAAFASREYGNLYIAAIKIRIGYGGPWVNTLAYVDDVTINDYFEDFEPPAYSCVGFDPPLDTDSVNVKNNKKVLPFKAMLVDGDGNPVTDISPPMLECVAGNGGSILGDPVAADLLPAGKGTDGNQFELTGDSWHFNLKLKNMGPATYECSMIPGNGYNIDPTCTVDVVIQD